MQNIIPLDKYPKDGDYKIIDGDYSGLIEKYSKTIDFDPTDDDAWFNRGTTRLKLHDFTGAIEDLTRSLELYPNDANAWYFRSVARYNDNDISGAVSDILKALEIDSKLKFEHRDDDPIYQGVHYYIYRIIDYNDALRKNPLDEDAIMERGDMKKSALEYDGAISDYTKVIKLNPRNSQAYFKRGYHKFYHRNDKAGAISDFDESIKINPDDAETYLFRSSVKESLGNLEGASADLTAIIEMPNGETDQEYHEIYYYASAYEKRGFIKDSQGDYIGAIEDFTSAINIDPESYFAYVYRSKTKITMQDYFGAIEDSTAAIKINVSIR